MSEEWPDEDYDWTELAEENKRLRADLTNMTELNRQNAEGWAEAVALNDALLKSLIELYYEEDVAGEKAWSILEKRWEIVKRLRSDPAKETQG